MARHFAAVVAAAVAMALSMIEPVAGQGAGIGGASPTLPGPGRNQGDSGPGAPSTQPAPPSQLPPARQPEGRETEAPPQFDNGGCQFRDRKLELIV